MTNEYRTDIREQPLDQGLYQGRVFRHDNNWMVRQCWHKHRSPTAAYKCAEKMLGDLCAVQVTEPPNP